jgi:AcrR family transcriptional regulator
MNHVMTTIQPDLRTQQLSDTRMRISRAVVEVIARDGLSALSFPAVADQAGVSLRTVYRHFPNKDALVAGATHHGSEEVMALFPMAERTLAMVPELLPALWRQLLSDRELLEIQSITPKGQELRTARLRERRDDCIEVIRREGIELPEEDMEAVGGLLAVLFSSSVLLDLVDRLGLDLEDAAAVTAFAIQAMADQARTKGTIR